MCVERALANLIAMGDAVDAVEIDVSKISLLVSAINLQ